MNDLPHQITYVLPIKWSRECDRDELTHYLKGLSALCDEVIVVDGSNEPDLSANHDAWGAFVRHVPPAPDLCFAMGKVNGVTTGLRLAANERVVIADDDVRYDSVSLTRASALLDRYDLVRPQNFFPAPMPWHAKWDTARTLLNRATGADFPGTLVIRRSTFQKIGAYDGDLIFENLELIRTVLAAGGSVHTAGGIFVLRLHSTTGRFLSQRVRQAYDDFALPVRMAVWLSLLPATVLCLRRRNFRAVAGGASVACAMAEAGRRRDNGTEVFPASTALFAPLWLAERAVCSWLAVGRYLTGGVRYGDRKIKRAATPMRDLLSQSRGGPS